MIYLQLFLTFFQIGFFGFGGGYGMLSLIQNQTVYNHAWLTAPEFTNIVAISQMTPGPISINAATYILRIHRHTQSRHGRMGIHLG